MEFKKFKTMFQKHFKEMTKDANKLFKVNVDKDEMWNLYLSSFPIGTNEVYRTRREYDCSCCRHFIKSIGNAVVIKNNQVHTLWEFDTGSTTFQPVVNALDRYIKSRAVTDVYVSKEKRIGTDLSRENGTPVITYDHFFLVLPDKFVNKSDLSKGDIQGTYRDTRNVFKRSLDEISRDSIETVLELITSNTLYKGEEWKGVLTEFLKYKKEYEKLNSYAEKENFAWEKSIEVGPVIGRIRNHSIGTLLVNITDGMDLDAAVTQYERITAPSNYKRPKEIFTKKMLEDAKKTIEELGYMDSLARRFATLDDITVNNILFSNKDSVKRIGGGNDIFAEMEKDVSSMPKKFSKVEEIPVDKFISDVLPTAKEIELYFENEHVNNMVSLIAPQNKESKTMFKWSNNFSWAYSGNMTDSMKQRVKDAGGKVDGVLRFSIQWNEDGTDNSDLDAHCIEPNGNHIFFGQKGPSKLGGELDVDIIQPGRNVAVENITWRSKEEMIPGEYKFFAYQYSRNTQKGFRAEVEFDGKIYSFEYNKPLRTGESITVAKVTMNKDGSFSIKEFLPSNVSSKEVWGIKTNQFIPVSVICYSPNYWDEQNGIGHRHVFFMLKDCINPESPNGMFNEYLKEELMKHKRVVAALGSKMRVADSDDQLSGVGFSTTKRASLVLKVKGATERVIKVKF